MDVGTDKLESKSETKKESQKQRSLLKCKGLEKNDDQIENKSVDTIWNYFNNKEDGIRMCLLCQESGIVTVYGSNTGTSNLRSHLATKHGFDFSSKSIANFGVAKKKPAVSLVWKYFCKPTRQGKILDDEYVYCGKCLEGGKRVRYTKSTSTTTLRKHLEVIHKIEVNDDEENDKPNISNLDVASIMEARDDDLLIKKRAKRVNNLKLQAISNTRLYFIEKIEDSDHRWCKLCEETGNPRKYSKNTSLTGLKRHLQTRHSFDPELDNSNQTRVHTGKISTDIPTDLIDRAIEITEKKLPKVKSYFINLNTEDPNLYCTFCLGKSIKTGYKTSTSMTNLKLHLKKHHDVTVVPMPDDSDTPKFDTCSDNSTESNETEAIDLKILERARNISEKSHLKPKEYFVQLDCNEPFVSCTFCLLKRKIHKYSSNSSSTVLKLHLVKQHNQKFEVKNNVKSSSEEIFDESEIEIIDMDTRSNYELDLKHGIEMENEDDNSESAEPKSVRSLLKEKIKPIHKMLVNNITEPPKPSRKYCRSCGNFESTFFSKFSNHFQEGDGPNENMTLRDIYYEIVGVATYTDDGMSQLICYTCEANLKTAYQFKRKAVKTEEKMMREFGFDQPIEYVRVKGEADGIENSSENEAEYLIEMSSSRKKRLRKNFDDDAPTPEYLEEFFDESDTPSDNVVDMPRRSKRRS